MRNKTLYLMVGIPGSGKTYFAKNKLMDGSDTWAYISRDEIRMELLPPDSKDYFAKEKEVYAQFIREVQAAIDSDEIHDIIADATHINMWSRLKLLSRLRLNNINVIPVVIYTPYIICCSRNSSRKGRAVVPGHVMKNMWDKFNYPDQDEYKYTAIIHVEGSA